MSDSPISSVIAGIQKEKREAFKAAMKKKIQTYLELQTAADNALSDIQDFAEESGYGGEDIRALLEGGA